ncbi:hypothetical protein H9L39_20197 [Fusarium oxysporum f. sp. albedinis]|nr:hypothetical protein H9L39_20197 [Fusarium oxysporum f. sp. albedinis]
MGADAFFINRNGLLCTTAQNSLAIGPGPQPMLLVSIALATASPSAAHALVFAVGRDLHLHVAL